MDQQRYFLLAIPAFLMALGGLLFAGRALLERKEFRDIRRGQDFLPYIAVSCLAAAVGFGAQSLMDNQQLSETAVVIGLVYLTGAV